MSGQEPTRHIAVKTDSEGRLRAKTLLTPIACRTRVRISIPPDKVLPIIFVPGIMGSNLKATRGNGELKPGEAAWRPPNGIAEARAAVKLWKDRDPAVRQKILNGATVSVDRDAATNLSPLHDTIGLTTDEANEHGWGEVHSESYQAILYALRQQFHSFVRPLLTGGDTLTRQWEQLNLFIANADWAEHDGPLTEISDCDVRRLAEYHYPVYAFGYNWLKSNGESAIQLRRRVEEIIGKWQGAGRKCSKVVLVTHSMGGLVARACAKEIPAKIAGIVHGCMPALGAPACYRRVACGTEQASPCKGTVGNYVMKQVSIILGDEPRQTVPVIGNSPGALELLPTHRYPRPWLFVSVQANFNNPRIISPPMENPYDFYADTSTWYRLADPSLLDPAQAHNEPVKTYKANVRQAEAFHRDLLDNFYHPNTYAFFGADDGQLAFGSFTWMAKSKSSTITDAELLKGRCIFIDSFGVRDVAITRGQNLNFSPSSQDAPGDGTVPIQSGQGPEGYAVRTIGSAGYDHQGGYNNVSMINLTLLLVSRIALQNV